MENTENKISQKAQAPAAAPKKKQAPKLEERTMKLIEELIEIGIPVKFASFHKAVNSQLGNTPEFNFYEDSNKASRRAKMWYTPHGLLTNQEGKYKIIPLANVADTTI
jgi:hypothetical protein